MGLREDVLAAYQAEGNGSVPALLESPTYDPIHDLLDHHIEDPEIMIDNLLYAEGIHLVSGEPGCGKSTLAMWCAYDQLSRGQHVIWLDMESGLRQTARRMQAIGVTGDMAREHLHYAAFRQDTLAYLERATEDWPRALIVVDSASKALAAAGINENHNDEVTGWFTQVVRLAKERQVPIMIIDHIAKTSANGYARGAGSKQADVDVHWRVEKDTDFSRQQVGLIHLHATKDRDGYLAFDLWFRVGDGRGGLPLVPASAADVGGSSDTKPAIG